jgi:dTDP-4-dehydrorhamnose 3,5-epimerase-like enzyme
LNANPRNSVAGNQSRDAAAHRRRARFFSEVWNARDFAAVGIGAAFVQDNHVRNPLKGTLRGLD